MAHLDKRQEDPPQGAGWDPNLYQSCHGFVFKYGEDLLDLLSVQPGERVLDVGCGTGQLTARIAALGADAIGVDSSISMVEEARRNYPEIRFEVADAAEMSFPQPFDAIFSNAALHWMKHASRVAQSLSLALKPGGRLVAEFGGHGNIKAVLAAFYASLDVLGCRPAEDPNPWYYPSVAEYASLLEASGLAVTYARLFDRPTPLDAGEDGLRQWLRMFGRSYLAVVPEEKQAEFLCEMEERLRPKLYQNGVWVLDYVRLRIVAVKA